MPAPAATPPIASVMRLLPALLVAIALAAAATFAVAQSLRWTAAADRLPAQTSTLLGAAALAVAALLGLAFLWPASNRAPARLGIMVLASSTTRMMGSLAVATVLLVIARPEPYSFFSALCLGFVLTLIVESWWAIAALNRVQTSVCNRTAPTGVPVR